MKADNIRMIAELQNLDFNHHLLYGLILLQCDNFKRYKSIGISLCSLNEKTMSR